MVVESVVRRGEKASERAYRVLRQMIVSLKVEAGSFVDEKSLSEQLGIGRTPVREALLRLAEQKLVEVMPRRGTFVTPIRVDDLRAVEELRWHLEVLAVRWAAERVTGEELVALGRVLDEAESGGLVGVVDWDVELDRSVHRLLASAAKNPFLAEQLSRLYDHSVRLLYANRSSMAPAHEEFPDYRSILAALEAGDAKAAAAAMKKHLLDSRARVASDFRSQLAAGMDDEFMLSDNGG